MNIIDRQRQMIRTIGILVFVLTVVQINFAQAATANITAQASLVTEMDVNGLKVLFKRRPNSQTVAAGLFIRGGSRNVTAQTAGIENLMMSVATEGSVKFPRAALRRELARTGSNISNGINYDYSVFALASTREYFERSWELFADVVLNPAFYNADVELMRQKLLTSLKDDEDNPDDYLSSLVNKTVNANSSYQNDPNGTVETISSFKVEALRAYHKSVMQSSQLLLVIVGDLDPFTLKQQITASFGKLPRGDYKDAAPTALDFSKPTLNVYQRNLPTNYLDGVFAAPSPRDPDFYAMRVATTLLRDRVFEEVRVKRNLSYAPSADMGSLSANTGNIYVSAVDANRAVSVMLNEINELKTKPVETTDITSVTGQFLTNYFTGEETNAAQAAGLARYELIGGGWRNSFEFLNRAREVKPADVQNAAKKYMRNLRFVVVGDPSAINRQIFLGN